MKMIVSTYRPDDGGSKHASVNFYQTTRRNIPEVSHLHTHRRENLKSQQERFYKANEHYGTRELRHNLQSPYSFKH
jgi:hypothetical protein